MFDDINLAVGKSQGKPRKERIERVKLISFSLLFAVTAISIILFLVNFRYSTAPIRKQQDQIKQSLSPYNDTVAKIYILNSRLSDISSLLKSRKSYSDNFSKLINLTGSGITVTNYEVKSEGGVTMSLSSASLSDIDKFLNDAIKLSDDGAIGSVTLTNLEKSDTQYSLAITTNLP